MKFTMTTILAAALATLSSAAALPADAAATAAAPLPAKFTLKFTTPISTSVIKQFEGPIKTDSYIGRTLNFGPGSNQEQKVVTFISKESGAIVVPDADLRTSRTLVASAKEEVHLWYKEFSGGIPSGVAKNGFTQTNGLLSVDLKDGKGPQSNWKACPDSTFKNFWAIHGGATTAANCVVVDLHVVAA